jgi:uncharacterized protein YceK
MRSYALIAALAALAPLCAGCASVMEGTDQPVTVETAPEAGAACDVSNERGSWSLTSPGTVVIKKSASVLQIKCRKPGYLEAKQYASAKMSNTALVGTMIPYVGILDAAVDGSSGAAQSYPSTFTLVMKPVPASPPAQTQPVQAATPPASKP